MAWIQVGTDSAVMNMQVDYQVIVPQTSGSHPALYLLHGRNGDGTFWIRRSNLELFVKDMGLAVIMSNGQNSFWRKLANGMDYFTFLTDELVRKNEQWLDISPERRYIGGWSMGGYGALHAALSLPGRYTHAIGLGAAICSSAHVEAVMPDMADFIFGHRNERKENGADLFALAEKTAASSENLPKIYMDCGRQDRFFDENERFAVHLQKLGFDVTFTHSDGKHDWLYCNEAIKGALNWLPEGRA